MFLLTIFIFPYGLCFNSSLLASFSYRHVKIGLKKKHLELDLLGLEIPNSQTTLKVGERGNFVNGITGFIKRNIPKKENLLNEGKSLYKLKTFYYSIIKSLKTPNDNTSIYINLTR